MDLSLEQDDRKQKFDLVYEAAKIPLPPVYVRSHKRARKMDTLRHYPWLRSIAKVVVAASQEEEYRAAGWGDILVVIPEGYGGHDIGAGRAVQYILDTAYLLGQDRVIILDDDMISINVLYGIGEGRVSRAWASHVGGRSEEFFKGCFSLVAQCAEEAFTAHPDAMLAVPQINNANRTESSSVRRWVLNMRGVNGAFRYWAVDRWAERMGEMNLKEFNYHGDDISSLIDMIQVGGQMVSVPTVITDWSDCETDSVMRTAETAPVLRQAEHEALMRSPLEPYILTKYDVVDRPQWHNINWLKLKKDGLVHEDERLWTDRKETK